MRWPTVFLIVVAGILNSPGSATEESNKDEVSRAESRRNVGAWYAMYKLDVYCGGHEEEEDLFTNATHRLGECMRTVVEPSEGQGTTGNTTRYKIMCRKQSYVNGCLGSFWKDLIPCFTEENKWIVAMAENMTYAAISYFCDNEIENIEKIVNGDGADCLREKRKHITLCGETHEPGPHDETAAGCLKIYSMEACIVDSLKECKNQSPANVINGLFDALNIYLPCPPIGGDDGARNSSHETS